MTLVHSSSSSLGVLLLLLLGVLLLSVILSSTESDRLQDLLGLNFLKSVDSQSIVTNFYTL